MATTLGTISTAIAGFAAEDDPTKKHKGAITHSTVELITTMLLPISIAMIGYALFVFYRRSEFIRRKQGPLEVAEAAVAAAAAVATFEGAVEGKVGAEVAGWVAAVTRKVVVDEVEGWEAEAAGAPGDKCLQSVCNLLR
ncbi:hypothetical protein N2152v2_007407 [Parachlorella kessleri]